MVKIVVNVNKQDVALAFSVGQAFPEVKGKLISIEVSGKELQRLQEKRREDEKELPLSLPDGACLTWHGRNAGRVLRDLRELFDR